MLEIFLFCIKIKLLGVLILLRRHAAWLTLNQRTLACFFAPLKLDIKPWETPPVHGNLKVQSSTWKRATIHRNENIFHSISNTHQMAKIITVAQRTADAFWQRAVSCILLYMVVWEKNCIWVPLGMLYWLRNTSIRLISIFFLLDLTGILFQSKPFGASFCHETWAANEIHSLSGYTAEHRGNSRLWCHQLILTIWIKKSISVTASKFNTTL